MSDVTLQARPSSPILELKGLSHSFEQAGKQTDVLKDCDLSLKAGQITALLGPSGSGKSTLLQLCGLLENPTAGHFFLKGEDVSTLSDGKRTALRQTSIGFVYQYHHLLPEFSALENVVIPQMIAGKTKKQAQARAANLLTSMGLDHRFDHRPARLSGGEQQRVAICRALANGPALLLADEPTGNLDPETSEVVFQLLISTAKDAGLSALIATHNHDLAKRMDRVVYLKQGHLHED